MGRTRHADVTNAGSTLSNALVVPVSDRTMPSKRNERFECVIQRICAIHLPKEAITDRATSTDEQRNLRELPFGSTFGCARFLAEPKTHHHSATFS